MDKDNTNPVYEISHDYIPKQYVFFPDIAIFKLKKIQQHALRN